MKKQLLGLFSLAGLASSPLEVEVELINDTFDGSSNLTKNTGNDWFLHVDDADDQWHAADCSEWSHGVGSYILKSVRINPGAFFCLRNVCSTIG